MIHLMLGPAAKFRTGVHQGGRQGLQANKTPSRAEDSGVVGVSAIPSWTQRVCHGAGRYATNAVRETWRTVPYSVCVCVAAQRIQRCPKDTVGNKRQQTVLFVEQPPSL